MHVIVVELVGVVADRGHEQVRLADDRVGPGCALGAAVLGDDVPDRGVGEVRACGVRVRVRARGSRRCESAGVE